MTAESGTERVVATPALAGPGPEPAGTVQATASRAAVHFGPGPAITGLRSPLVFVVAASETQADAGGQDQQEVPLQGAGPDNGCLTTAAALGLVAKLVLPRALQEMRKPAFERRR